jgi:hypothetical protein
MRRLVFVSILFDAAGAGTSRRIAERETSWLLLDAE